jgi:hypothetical protein
VNEHSDSSKDDWLTNITLIVAIQWYLKIEQPNS